MFFLVEEDYPRTLQEFEKRFRDEDACRDYLFALRYPEGFVCSCCKGRTLWKMGNGLLLCKACRRQSSVTAGTIFHRSHLSLMIWFRAMWYATCQKNGTSAIGLQRILGLGSYRTAWMVSHKMRRAMVRHGRERLRGTVEVDETYWGAKEKDVIGRQTEKKSILAVAAEEDSEGIGRIRLRQIENITAKTLRTFITESIEEGSVIRSDGSASYIGLDRYTHERVIQQRQPKGEHLLPLVHLVISLLKRWLMGTHQGAVSRKHLDYYLDEFTFRFNRRKSNSRGKLFFRLVQQAAQADTVSYKEMVLHNR